MYYFRILSFLMPFILTAQSINVNPSALEETNLSAENLVKEVLLNGGDCSDIEWVSTVENPSGENNLSKRSWGYFEKGNSNFPFEKGIVLSSGYAQTIGRLPGNLANDYNSSWNSIGDNDLEIVSGERSLNTTAFTFKFTPQGGQISFNYIFASEEYGNPGCSEHHQYLDAFVFLISGPGIENDPGLSGKNIALIPDTNIPISIGNVYNNSSCPSPSSANPEYYDLENFKSDDFIFNGRTKVLTANTLVEANQEYTIKLVVSDAYNGKYDSAVFLEASSFNIGSVLVNENTDEVYNNKVVFCEGSTVPLKIETALENPTFQWYKEGVLLAGETQSTYSLSEQGNYQLSIESGSCSDQMNFEASWINAPNPSAQILRNCSFGNTDQSIFTLEEAAVLYGNNQWDYSYYLNQEDAQNQVNELSGNYKNINNPQTLITRVENDQGCVSYVDLTLEVEQSELENISLINCGENDFSTFDLTNLQNEISGGFLAENIHCYLSYEDALLEQNELGDSYQNTYGNQKIYAKVSGECVFAELTLKVNNKPDLSSIKTEHYLCESSFVNLEIPAIYSSYLWSNGATTPSISVTEQGEYSVSVEDENACVSTQVFNVQQAIDISIQSIKLEGNSLSVYMAQQGDYEYSLDQINWQDSPIFLNLGLGLYTIYVRSELACTIVSAQKNITGIPNVFTPNGDGFNDFWELSNIENSEGAIVEIYDRYGKLLVTEKVKNYKWDGTYLGQPVVQGDYWYVLKYKNGDRLTGSLSLIRK